MELSDMQARVTELEQQISALPAGSVTKKTVSGKDYFYHRWMENKKRREKYIPADELESFRAQIEPMSAPARRCVPLRHLSVAIAGASASGSCTTLSTASRRTRCSFSTACAGRGKPP